MKENILAAKALDISFKTHRQYGPGLLESIYKELLCHELDKTGIPYQRQQAVPLIHEGLKLGIGYRADIIIDNCLLLELKSVEALAPIHFSQTLSYLKLTDLRLGLLINFNVLYLKDGIHRIANRMEN
jgi:GxxExxY protein